jgi:hypothetical protein
MGMGDCSLDVDWSPLTCKFRSTVSIKIPTYINFYSPLGPGINIVYCKEWDNVTYCSGYDSLDRNLCH